MSWQQYLEMKKLMEAERREKMVREIMENVESHKGTGEVCESCGALGPGLLARCGGQNVQ